MTKRRVSRRLPVGARRLHREKSPGLSRAKIVVIIEYVGDNQILAYQRKAALHNSVIMHITSVDD